MSYIDDKTHDSRDDSPGYVSPDRENMSVGTYIATRIPTLKPPMNKAPNPFKLLALLNFQQWMFFLVGFLGWSWDAFDFFTVSLTVPQLAKQFDKENTQITWGITLVLMFRSVGSVIFGENCQILELDAANLVLRHRCRQVWAQMAFRRQQHPFHRPRTRNRLLQYLQPISSLSRPFRHSYGWTIRQCSGHRFRGLP